MKYVPTPIAVALTGLSTDKLREWTSRRALIPADVRPSNKGSPAQFSWQTILVLRIAVLLRERFHMELQAHKTSFINLRTELLRHSFITLWEHRIAMTPDQWIIVDEDTPIASRDTLLIHLDPHLKVLRDGFAFSDIATDHGQLDLFSLPNLYPVGRSKTFIKTVVSGRR